MTDNNTQEQCDGLLIANGQQTADLLRQLAENEIDSDSFAVTSECESYGKETDAELSITEFALRAAGYVDALVEALIKAQKLATQQGNIACALFDEVNLLRRNADDKAPELRAQLIEADSELETLRQRIAELEAMNPVPTVPTMGQLIAGRKQIAPSTGKMSRLMSQRLADVYRAMVVAAKGE